MSNYKVSITDPITSKMETIIKEFEILKTQAEAVSSLIAELYQDEQLDVKITPVNPETTTE